MANIREIRNLVMDVGLVLIWIILLVAHIIFGKPVEDMIWVGAVLVTYFYFFMVRG